MQRTKRWMLFTKLTAPIALAFLNVALMNERARNIWPLSVESGVVYTDYCCGMDVVAPRPKPYFSSESSS